MTQQVGIIDLGSNTARMIVMQYKAHHSFELIDEVKVNVRLAHNLGNDNMLQPDTMHRAIEALKMFSAFGRALQLPRMIAVATSAVRDAANQETFLALVKQKSGLDLRILSGYEEAYYGYLGVVNSLTLNDGCIFDLGGGSVELCLVRGRGLSQALSLPLGTVRLTERFLSAATPSKGDIKALERYIDEELDQVEWFKPLSGMSLVGVGGTVRNLAKIDQQLVKYPIDKYHGYRIPIERIDEWTTRISKMSPNEREAIEGLNNERADIILGGLLLIRRLMQRSRASQLWVSGQGLRDGLFYEQFLAGSEPPLLTNVRRFTIENLARLYNYQVVHANKVRDLSLALFDQLTSLHSYGAWERELLEAAAILHDIGVSVNYYDHHKHSLYLVMHSPLLGFSHREQALIGLLTRFHRKGNVSDEGLGGVLADGDMTRIAKLSALLRIAEYLERSKSQVIQGVTCSIERDRVRIKVQALGDPTVEVWDANRRTGLFRRAYGVEAVIE